MTSKGHFVLDDRGVGGTHLIQQNFRNMYRKVANASKCIDNNPPTASMFKRPYYNQFGEDFANRVVYMGHPDFSKEKVMSRVDNGEPASYRLLEGLYINQKVRRDWQPSRPTGGRRKEKKPKEKTLAAQTAEAAGRSLFNTSASATRPKEDRPAPVLKPPHWSCSVDISAPRNDYDRVSCEPVIPGEGAFHYKFTSSSSTSSHQRPQSARTAMNHSDTSISRSLASISRPWQPAAPMSPSPAARAMPHAAPAQSGLEDDEYERVLCGDPKAPPVMVASEETPRPHDHKIAAIDSLQCIPVLSTAELASPSRSVPLGSPSSAAASHKSNPHPPHIGLPKRIRSVHQDDPDSVGRVVQQYEVSREERLLEIDLARERIRLRKQAEAARGETPTPSPLRSDVRTVARELLDALAGRAHAPPMADAAATSYQTAVVPPTPMAPQRTASTAGISSPGSMLLGTGHPSVASSNPSVRNSPLPRLSNESDIDPADLHDRGVEVEEPSSYRIPTPPSRPNSAQPTPPPRPPAPTCMLDSPPPTAVTISAGTVTHRPTSFLPLSQ